MVFIVFYFTLFFAVRHQETEISGQTADCPGGQGLERTEPLSVRLAEADHGHGGAWGAHVLTPLQASDPRQRTLKPREGKRMIFQKR